MEIDKEKVRELFDKLNDISFGNYREFEIALLIMERLCNVIEMKDEITDEVIERVNNICESYDTLFNEYVNEDLDILENEIESEVEDDE